MNDMDRVIRQAYGLGFMHGLAHDSSVYSVFVDANTTDRRTQEWLDDRVVEEYHRGVDDGYAMRESDPFEVRRSGAQAGGRAIEVAAPRTRTATPPTSHTHIPRHHATHCSMVALPCHT